jgi:hypothetical protein
METYESRSTADRVRLFLLAGQARFRASLGRRLSSVPDFDLVGESAIDEAALELLRGSAADVALLELDPDTVQAREFMAQAVRSGYSGRFFVITAMLDARDSARAVQMAESFSNPIPPTGWFMPCEWWQRARCGSIRELSGSWPIDILWNQTTLMEKV